MAHYVPKIEHWSIFNTGPMQYIKEWLVYISRLLKKPLDDRATAEVRDARPFLTEVGSMTNLCPSEFASTRSSDRKEVASIASDLIAEIDQTLRKVDAKKNRFGPWTDAELLELI